MTISWPRSLSETLLYSPKQTHRRESYTIPFGTSFGWMHCSLDCLTRKQAAQILKIFFISFVSLSVGTVLSAFASDEAVWFELQLTLVGVTLQLEEADLSPFLLGGAGEGLSR